MTVLLYLLLIFALLIGKGLQEPDEVHPLLRSQTEVSHVGPVDLIRYLRGWETGGPSHAVLGWIGNVADRQDVPLVVEVNDFLKALEATVVAEGLDEL
jgi:hypothetical protein